jgi:hypothetical protein
VTAPAPLRPVPPPPPSGNALSKQYGPLPLGAWIVVIGGALGIAWYTTRNTGPKQIVEDISGTPGVGTGAQSMWIQTNAPPTMVQDTDFETNEEWARACVNYLIAQGFDAALADTAIRKYLQSLPLSLSERAMVTLALAKYGAPPILLPDAPVLPEIPKPVEPPVVIPPPVVTPPPVQIPGVNHRWVWVTPWPTKTSTLWGISSVVYGNGSKWPTLYNANRVGVTRPDGSKGMIKNPNLIYVGWKIYCP